MPTIKFWNPASDAEKVEQLKTELKDLEQELALRQDTGRDLVTQLLWEKDSRKEAIKKYAGLQQERLQLQDEHTAYVLAAARAEQANEELQAKLHDLQEELVNVEAARDSNWEDYRQALIDNNRLTQEVQSLKAKVAAMQKAQSMTPAQQTLQSTVKFPIAKPLERVNTSSPTFSSAQVKRASFAGLGRSPLSNISNTQVLYDRARLAGSGLSPLGSVSNTQGIGRLQAKRTTSTPLSKLGLGTSPRIRPPSALLGGDSAKLTSSDNSPAIKFPVRTEVVHTPVGTPKANLLLATPTGAATGLFAPRAVSIHSLWAQSPSIDSPAIKFPMCAEALHTPVVTPKADFLLPTPTGAATGLFAPPTVGTHSLWARSPSMDSQTYRDMFRPASSCGSDFEEPAPASTPRPSWVLKAGSSYSSSNGEDGVAFTSPESAVMPKVRSSSGVYSPPPMSHTSESPRPLSTSGAVLAIPGPTQATEVEYLRWRYRCTDGSCSCLGSLDSDESPLEASQRLQSAESSTPPGPPSGKPKYLSRQELLEEHWGYGHSSCNDSESNVSAVSECTIRSEARWSPAATASSPARSTGSPHSNILHLDTGVSYGELNFEVNRLLLDSPLSTASAKSQCPVPAAPSPIATAAAPGPIAKAAAPGPIATAAARGPIATAAAPGPIATARPRCRATASPGTAEARGSNVQSGRAAAPRPALRTSTAAGGPVQRGALHHQSTTATAVTPVLQPAHPAASSKSMSVDGKKVANKPLHSTPVPAVAGVTTRRQTAAAAAAGVTTRGQAAAAAQHKTTPTSGVGAASSRPRQARSLKPEAPTRRQPQRAAKPQWR